MPKRVKYRKQHRERNLRGCATRGCRLAFGEYGLQALEGGWISARQIEAARLTITRTLHHGGKLWIRIFPDKSITKKPAETRMGGGKGDVCGWVAVVLPGRILFEVGGVGKEQAERALRLCSHKLSVRTRIISRSLFH